MDIPTKNSKKKAAALILILIVCSVIAVIYWIYFIPGSLTRIDYTGNESSSHWSGSYTRLSGMMEKNIQPDKAILRIQTTTESGRLSITIKDESGNTIFDKKEMGTGSSDLPVSGPVTIQLKGKDHKGGFDIRQLPASSKKPPAGQIYLYGEAHDNTSIMEQQLELWNIYYQNYGIRDLFIEWSYAQAEFLNLWMQSDSDEILEQLYQDFEGTLAHSRQVMDFYKQIKQECPETIFHGTDIAFQYDKTEKRFMEYLESNGQKGSEQYHLAQEASEQGQYYRQYSDDTYRENKLAENFIREYEKLKGASVMGIYGSAHAQTDAMEFMAGEVPCMANQLYQKYQDALYSEDLSASYTVDTLQIQDKRYTALYYGKENMAAYSPDYQYREIWRLEDAYEDFKDHPNTYDALPYNQYPLIEIEPGQVFVIDLTEADGSVTRRFYRSDGTMRSGIPVTEEFTLS